MSGFPPTDERLRAAQAAHKPGPGPVPRPDCPPTDMIWQSATGGLAGPENAAMIEHTVTCAACAASWRLARELRARIASDSTVTAPESPATAGEKSPRLGSLRRSWVIPLAASLTLALAGWWLVRELPQAPPAETTYRQVPEITLSSLVPTGHPMPRDDFVLRWSGAPEGARFDVRVTDEWLHPVDRAFGLDAAEYRVAPEALASLPAGAFLQWRVTAHLADGREVWSPTFRTELE